jgi:hypothetical protein
MAEADSPDPTTPFERLPENLRREVFRTFARNTGLIALALAAFCGLFGLLAGWGIQGDPAITIAFFMFGLMTVYLVPILVGVYLLVVGAGAWPGVLPAARLAELYQIGRDELSGAAYRRQMGQRGYWTYGLTGAAMVCGMAALASYLWMLASGWRPGPPTGILIAGLAGYSANVKAWMVRRIAAERREKAVAAGVGEAGLGAVG